MPTVESLLQVIQLSTKLLVGLLLTCVALLWLDGVWFSLYEIWPQLRGILTMVAVGLAIFAAIGVVVDTYQLIRSTIQGWRAEARSLARLHTLSGPEWEILLDGLSHNTQSVITAFHNPAGTALVAKGLLIRHGGSHDARYWPHTIPDFVWDKLQTDRENILKNVIIERPRQEAPNIWR